MKKNNLSNRFVALLFCLTLMFSVLTTSISAAKENFLDVSSAGITGIDAPVAGKKGDYTAEVVNTGVYTIENIDYYERATDKLHPSTDTFRYDTEYYVLVTIKTKSAYYFVTSQFTGESTAAVSCNGDAAMVVDVGEDNAHIIGIKYYFPKTEKDPNPVQGTPGYIIEHVGIVGLAEPKTSETPSYRFGGYSHSSYTRDSDVNDEYYVNGVCWSFAGGRSLPYTGETFLPDEAYQVTIRLVPKPGYQFATKANGDTAMTASINGKTVEIIGNSTSAKLTYTFPKTEKIALTEAAVTDIDAPVVGQTPDYTASYGSSYSAANENTASAKNGITWYNETDQKPVNTASSFEAGKIYTVQISIWPDDGEIFQYSDGAYHVSGTINGKKAEIMGRGEYEIILCYTFPKLEEPKHEHSPLKVDEVKATCSAEGRKTYYFCPECGKNFEDSKCTKEITDINAWGTIAKLEHTGGKATCTEQAKCKNCGIGYGELAAHNYGTSWDYTDAAGHAHTCKTCGAHDPVQAHSGGAAKCGEKAKCTACKAEYGKTGDHKWGTAWEYTDTKGHAHKCTVCGEHDDIIKHTPGAAATEKAAQTCTACAYIIEPAKQHEHTLSKVAGIDVSCTTTGKEQHYVCNGCGKIFSDSKGNKEITDKDSLRIPATGHKESKWQSDTEFHWKECTVKGCGAVTVEKEAHELNKSGKCTVCGFKSGNKTETSQPTETETETKPEEITVLPDPPDTPETSDPSDISTEETAPNPETEEVNDPSPAPEEENTDYNVQWIILMVLAGTVVVCMIVITVVVVKKNL